MADAEDVGGKHRPHAAFEHRDFRLFQSARFLSVIGTQMQSVAVGWQVYEVSGRALDLGYVGLAQFFPAVGLSLVTGHVADRFDRRKILLVYYVCMALSSLALFWLAARGERRLLPILGVLCFIGTARAFAGPASQALLPEIVPPQDFGNAVAWNSSTWQLATIIGPAVGGGVFAALHGAAPVYLVSSSLCLLGLVLCSTMRVRTGRKELRDVSLETLFAGLRYVWERKLILGSISLDLFAVLLGGAVALLPVFARDVLHVGPWGFGLLRSAPAIGATVMAIFLAWRPIKSRAGAKMFLSVLIFGLATIGFGLSTSFWLSLCCLIVIGASDMVSVVVRQTLVQLTTPSAMRGRVSAVNLVFIGASNELGEFESGITAAWWGAVPAVVIGGVGTCLVVALWSAWFPALRKVDQLTP